MTHKQLAAMFAAADRLHAVAFSRLMSDDFQCLSHPMREPREPKAFAEQIARMTDDRLAEFLESEITADEAAMVVDALGHLLTASSKPEHTAYLLRPGVAAPSPANPAASTLYKAMTMRAAYIYSVGTAEGRKQLIRDVLKPQNN